jgi:hypothetical protein
MNKPRPEPTPTPVWEIISATSKGKFVIVEARIAGNQVARSGCAWVDYQLKFETKGGLPSCVGGTYKISNVAAGDAFATRLPDNFLRACGSAALAARKR